MWISEGLKACNFVKKKLEHRCFLVNIAKFLRTPFFIEHLWWLLLILVAIFKKKKKKKTDLQVTWKLAILQIVYKKTDELYIEWQRVVQRVTRSDNEWHRVVQRMTTISTTSDNEWYSEWQPMKKTSNEWQREKTNDKEWYNEWKQMREIFISEWNNYTIKTTIYSATSYWKYNVNQNIWRSSHRRCSTKKAAPNNFAIFAEKHLKACNFI